MSLRRAISVVMGGWEQTSEVAPVRGGWPVIAVCAAGLVLTVSGAPAMLAVPASATQRTGSGLPGPAPDCPPRHGITAPASTPWAQQVLSFAAVWDLTRGAGVTVAVVDSGVDANPQFGNRVIPGPDLAGNEPGDPGGAGGTAGNEPGDPGGAGNAAGNAARDAAGNAAGNADCVGHGTSVAAIIAAAPMAGISFTGVAPAARILSVKISDSDVFSDNVAPEAIRDAVELGASVINLSLATTADTAALRSAVDFALGRDVVVVAAAGNDDLQSGTGPFYPAAYPGVLSVGAVGPDGSLASFSDTHTPVSVTAPGVNITSAYPGTFPAAYDPADNGTSFAAAFVSGVAALVRSYHPRLDQAQVVARIEATADGAAGPGTGHGLINPVQAVTAIGPAAELAGAGDAKADGQATHVSITRAKPPGRHAGNMALTVSGGSFGIMIVVLAAVIIIPAARRRSPG